MSLASKIHLRPEEKIITAVRRYSLVDFWKYLFGAALMFASAFFLFWLITQGILGYVIFILGLITGLFAIFLTWFFNHANVLVVTNERVVDIARTGLFEEYLTTIGFFDIKDIFATRRGILAALFGYGLVTISAKGGEIMIETDPIKRPQAVVNVILEAREEYRQKRRVGTNEAIYKNFIKIISDLPEEELCEVKDLIDARLTGLGEAAQM